MHKNPNGCESFMIGLRALGDGFGFFFFGLRIALRIWFAKGRNSVTRLAGQFELWIYREWRVSTWGLMAIIFTLTVTVSYWSLALEKFRHI